MCACVVALRGLEYALFSVTPGLEAHASALHFPLTAWLGALFVAAASSSAASLANAIVLVSALKVITSMTWLTVVGIQTGMGVAWHRFVAILNLYTRRNADGTKSLGPADHMLIDGKPVTSEDDFDDLPEDTVLGVGTVDDFSWKARLDLYSCTECGRCQELCPAWNTQKPLSPKLLIMGLRDHMESASNVQIVEQEEGHQKLEDGEVLLDKGVPASPHSFDLVSALSLSGATGPEGVSAVTAPLVPEVVSEEVLWDCTNCGACVEQCPVDIEHIDHILDLRRHQVLMEGAFPRELGRAFRGMESKANPYNQAARKRMDWAKKLDFDIPVVGEDIEDASQVDYLFWVGCAGAYDDTAKKTSAAVAELLHTAGVSFAVLGSGESCTGDPARRAGNEALFQMLAAQAIDTLTEAKPQKIVVSCAHCFNTIAGEYPELGGHFDVVHHTQLLNRLVRDGLLTPVPPTASTASAASASEDATDEAGAGTAGTAPSVGTPLKVTYTTRASWDATTVSTSRRASSWVPCRTWNSSRCRATATARCAVARAARTPGSKRRVGPVSQTLVSSRPRPRARTSSRRPAPSAPRCSAPRRARRLVSFPPTPPTEAPRAPRHRHAGSSRRYATSPSCCSRP